MVVLLADCFVIGNRRIDNLHNIDTGEIHIDPIAKMRYIYRRHNYPYIDLNSRFEQERLLWKSRDSRLAVEE